MSKIFNRLRSGLIAISIVFIVLGIALIIWPNTSMDIIVYLMGAIVLVAGLLKVISYLKSEQSFKSIYEIIEGTIFLIAGLMMVFFSEQVIQIMTYIFGIYICFDGIMNLQKGFEFKKLDYHPWKIVLPIGAITLVIGIIFLCHPFNAMEMLVLMMGVVLVYDGVINLYIAFCARQVIKTYGEFNEEDIIDEDPIERIENDE